jgi:hypothetical protein
MLPTEHQEFRNPLGGLLPDRHPHFTPNWTALLAHNVTWREGEQGASLGTRHGFDLAPDTFPGKPVNVRVIYYSNELGEPVWDIVAKLASGRWQFLTGDMAPMTGTKDTPGWMFIFGGELYVGDSTVARYYDPLGEPPKWFSLGLPQCPKWPPPAWTNFMRQAYAGDDTGGMFGVYRYFLTLHDSKRKWDGLSFHEKDNAPMIVCTQVTIAGVKTEYNEVAITVPGFTSDDNDPVQADRYRLWRTTGFANYIDAYRASWCTRAAMVREFTLSADPKQVIDHTADNELNFASQQYMFDGARPLPCNFAVPYLNTVLWLEINDPSRSHMYEWSIPGRIGMVPRALYNDFGVLDGKAQPIIPKAGEHFSACPIQGPITAIHADSHGTLIFTRTAVYTVLGSPQAPYIVQIEGIKGGAINQAAISSGKNGLVTWDGIQLKLIRPDHSIEDLAGRFGIRSVLLALGEARERVVVGCFDTHDQIWFGVDTGPVYILDLARERVSVFTSAAFGHGLAAMLEVSPAGKMYVFDQSGSVFIYPSDDFADGADPAYYVSDYMALFGQEDLTTEKQVDRFLVRVADYNNAGNNKDDLYVGLNGYFEYTYSPPMPHIPLLMGPSDVYRNDTLSLVPTRLPKGRMFQFYIYGKDNNSWWRLDGLERVKWTTSDRS